MNAVTYRHIEINSDGVATISGTGESSMTISEFSGSSTVTTIFPAA